MSNLLSLPSDFSDYEWEVTSKGFFSDAQLSALGKSYRLSFYDVVRLSQEIASELGGANVFFEPNLIVVRSVTRVNMELAAEELFRSGKLTRLTPE